MSCGDAQCSLGKGFPCFGSIQLGIVKDDGGLSVLKTLPGDQEDFRKIWLLRLSGLARLSSAPHLTYHPAPLWVSGSHGC